MKPENYGRVNERGPTPAPLTEKDGAARVSNLQYMTMKKLFYASNILHPIFIGLSNEERPPYGVLYKNYEVVPWN